MPCLTGSLATDHCFTGKFIFLAASLSIGSHIVALRGAGPARAVVGRAGAAISGIPRRSSAISIITVGDNSVNFHVNSLCFEMFLSKQ
jgi:hypothetical protein